MSPPPAGQTGAGSRRHGFNDPVRPGISVGSAGRLNRGTIAAIVREMGESDLCILSCNHVLSALAGHEGDAVCQPGRADEDRPGKNRLGAFVRGTSTPAVDAAVARIEHRGAVREILGLGVPVDAIATPSQDDLVVLSGVGSGDTNGRVYGHVVSSDLAPDDADSSATEFFAIRLKSPGSTRPGDSGAAWMLCDEQGEPTATMVGLHIGVGSASGLARACFAEKVFDALAIVPASDSEVEAHNAGVTPPPTWTETAASPPALSKARHRVSARGGLYLRSIAQRGDDAVDRLVPFGTTVWILSRVRMADGDWSQVDLQGDGKADGFMYSAYLVPADGS